ncbi:MAG: glycosyltransferase family 39 protein [Candidatus Krumholzibacteria bacterium]|nr:glycosyltransferase family 39 protein [Candidatus Krumholzibacteria bacterium]
MKNITTERILFAGLSVFLFAALFLVDDYGMNTDSQKNFREGEMNLDYILTGRVDRDVLQWQMHGAIIQVAAEVSKRLFHDSLGLYDATAARHIILPFMTAGFLVCLFYFVKRHWSALHGLMTVGLLLTFPYFWGQTFNNLKDVPLLILFSLSVMCFVEWVDTRALKYFYGFFLFLGLAIAVKTYAFLVIPVILAWILIRPVSRDGGVRFPRPASILHVIAALSAAIVIVLAFYAPAFWGVGGKLAFLETWHEHVKGITYGHGGSFSLNSFAQVLFRTPLLVLIFTLAGLFTAARRYPASSLHSLLLIWLMLPLIIPCFPRTLIYHNGMRLFMVFLVPFCILSSIGIGEAAGLLARKPKRDRETLARAIASVTIGVSLWGVVATHPYQTTFFNALAGGLKGAQEKRIADSWDYWLNSYREAERWIDRYGALKANVAALYISGTPPKFQTDLMRDAIDRVDLTVARFPALPARAGKIAFPGNTYVILIPFDYLRMSRLFIEQSKEFQKAYTISRQGGEICTIYYKPLQARPD